MKLFFSLMILFLSIAFISPSYGETYKWVDDQGQVHFTDDLSKIPEKYREEIETRKSPKEPKETSRPETETPVLPPTPQTPAPEGITVDLIQRGEVSMAEVVLNERISQHFVVDTGASFTVISKEAAQELGITIDESTPFLPITTASSVIFNPLVTLKSIRVGGAVVENVDVLIHDLPGGSAGLLGNSFLNKFAVALNTFEGTMTLTPMQGKESPDRPGGYGRSFWTGRFRFYNQILNNLKNLKQRYERKGADAELKRLNKVTQYFENQLSDLEHKASLAGVPRSWRQ